MWAIIGWYGVWSLAAFTSFAWDKLRAASGGWRVPERTLHLMTLLGGAAGSVAAMILLRHKTRKPAFVLVPGLAVAAHAVAWLLLLLR